LRYAINLQQRYAAARVTVERYTCPVQTPQKTFSPYGDSDEESDCPPPSPKKTDATEMKIDESLKIHIEALPHLETLHYGFKFQALSGNGYCFCALAKCLSPWRKKYHIDNDYSVCAARQFHGQGLLQHCHDKGDDYHIAAAFNLTNLFKNGTGLTQAALHHGTNDQSRTTAEGNSGCYFQDIDSQESNHPYQVNESILDNAGDTVREGTSTLSGQEIPGQCAKDNDGFNLVDKTTDTNGNPSKDSKHTDGVENSTIDEPDGILDNVEVNLLAEGNDTYGHPSQESVVIVDAENSNIDGLNIIHDSSKTIDTNVVDFDGDRDDVLQKELPVQSVHESKESNTVDKAIGVNGDPNKDSDHANVAENMVVDASNDSSKTIDTNGEQIESIVDFDVDRNDVLQKELPVQSVHESKASNTVDKAIGVNGDPNKDSDHTNIAENMVVDASNLIFDSVELNTVAKENNVHDVCVQEITFNDGNSEQTTSNADDEVEQNDVS
jgi:hypothetical protein